MPELSGQSEPLSITYADTPVCGRRAALLGVGAVGLTGLSACAASPDDVGDAASSVASQASSAVSDATEAVKDLARAAEIPVGGGKVFPDAGVIITQPTRGEFKAFTNICTHQGSKIDSVHDGVMECPLHHSKFDIATGAVVSGLATRPLPTKTVDVDGDGISVN